MSEVAEVEGELKRISGTSTTQLIIQSLVGKRHILHDLFVTGPASGGYADIWVGTRVYMRVPFGVANCDTVNPPQVKKNSSGFLDLILKAMKATNLRPNAAQDENITINLSGEATRVDAYYLETDSGDVSSHAVEGGSDYPVKPFVDILTGTATNTGVKQSVLKEVVPTGMNLLGTNGRIAPDTTFNMYILAADYVSSGSDYTEYSRLHVYDEDEELFTPDNDEGLLTDWTIPAVDIPFSLKNNNYWVLAKPYTWNPNHLMSLLLDVPTVTGTGSAFNLWLMGLKSKSGAGGGAGGGAAAPAGGA